MRRLLASFGILLLTSASAVHAQDITTDACVSETYSALLKEQLFYRSVVFGQQRAETLPIGAVRYDDAMKPWTKTGTNEWKTYAEGFTRTTWSNSLMDSKSYPPARTGIIETKKALTSELLPSLLQAMRAFQCRLQYVCTTALRSRDPAAPATIRVSMDGCVPLDMRRINACKGKQEADPTSLDVTQFNVQVGVCDQAAAGMLEREQNLLKLTISYDAAYRSFLQFAGIAQGLGSALRTPIIGVLSDMVQTLKQFGSIPCFTSQCNVP